MMNDLYYPKYPLYIVSKNRADSMLTSRSLARMKVYHYIAIEPHNFKSYDAALDTFDIRKYVTLLILPFENHGQGPGRARNWCWDHSSELGAEKHWVMDDNISDFYRLNRNLRARVETGAGFRACEDFVDRFENVPVSGLQYRFFIAPNSKYPPYVKNTRIYSCQLNENKFDQFKQRGKYNEDTDQSLRVLKSGFCTIQFNFFLQGKSGTQAVAGGNTEEFYHKEGAVSKEKWRDGMLNPMGTYQKSKMLCDLHPDVCRMVNRYARVHHYVDYSPFKKNQLILKSGINLTSMPKVNEYGLKFTDNWQG